MRDIKIGMEIPSICGKVSICTVIGLNDITFKGTKLYHAALHVKGTACACSKSVIRIQKEIEFKSEVS